MSTAASPPPSEAARIIVIMGVASSGKSAVGKALARRLHAPFLDGDGFHPAANKEKMRTGTALTDEDRWPWLETLALALREAAETKGIAVGACSALKRSYRDFLKSKAGLPLLFVHLHGEKVVLAERIACRRHEYMPASLLDSQLATLEMPAPDEGILTMSILDPVETIADRITKSLPHLKIFRRGQ